MIKNILIIFVFIFCLKATANGLNLGIFIEPIAGPELGMIKKSTTGAVLDELLKMIDQKIPVITSTILLIYLKKLFEEKSADYRSAQKNIEQCSLFTTTQGNFCLIIPSKNSTNLNEMGFNKNLRCICLNDLTENRPFTIEIKELESIFCSQSSINIEKKIYLSGHGKPTTWDNVPIIAGLKLEEYKKLINFFNQIKCRMLFVSSCYAAGINMINAHSNLSHGFPIIIGNLTDSFSMLHPNINFRKYFSKLSSSLKNLASDEDLLFSNDLKTAIQKICGSSLNNTPWIKFKDSERFFLLNLGKHLIINRELISHKFDKILVNDEDSLLFCSIKIGKSLKLSGTTIPTIVSVVPGSSCHLLRYISAKKHTLYDLINSVIKNPYEFTKIFFCKKVKIKKPKRKFNKFKPKTIKKLLIINCGTQDLFLNSHEVYFQSNNRYHKITIPYGTKLGCTGIDREIIPFKDLKISFKA